MRSLRLRLLLSLLAVLALAAALGGALTYRRVLDETQAIFDYQLQQMALSLRDQGEIAPDQAQALADQQLDFVVQIWTVDGRSIYASRPHASLPARALLGLADISVDGQRWRTYGVATPQRVIQVAQPVVIRQRLAAQAAWRSVWPLAATAPLFALLAWWVVAQALAPLATLAREVRGRDAPTLAPLPERGLPEEVAPLVVALNALLARLKASFDTQRAFVADAAHELRSPLTALKLQLQLLQRAPDDAARGEAVRALSEGVDRATRLVEQLLTLARAEPGAAPPALEPLDLAALVREAAAATAPLASARGVTLSLDAPDRLALRGERLALLALARNLVDNAVRYVPTGGRVHVQLADTPAAATLTVDDDGPGIPPGDRERVFDRFVRRDDGGDATGSGLGLAIVRSVALRHRGEVSLEDSPLGGLRAQVRLPHA